MKDASTGQEINLHEIYTRKAHYIRHNFKEAVRIKCPFDNPIFKSVIRDEIYTDTPPELLGPLNKLAHTLVAEYDNELKATIIKKA